MMLIIRHVYTPKFWSPLNYKVVPYISSENCWETQNLEATAIIIHHDIGRRLGKSDRRTTTRRLRTTRTALVAILRAKKVVGSNHFVPQTCTKPPTRWTPPKWFGKATVVLWLVTASVLTFTSLSFNHNYSTLIGYDSDIIVAAILYRIVGQGVKLTSLFRWHGHVRTHLRCSSATQLVYEKPP